VLTCRVVAPGGPTTRPERRSRACRLRARRCRRGARWRSARGRGRRCSGLKAWRRATRWTPRSRRLRRALINAFGIPPMPTCVARAGDPFENCLGDNAPLPVDLRRLRRIWRAVHRSVRASRHGHPARPQRPRWSVRRRSSPQPISGLTRRALARAPGILPL
jgi:hypothetical protein